MRFTHIEIRNWKNFTKADVDLARRVFIIGSNASGKSNFLEAFKFLRDLVLPGGGLAEAVRVRGGMKKVRSLHARRTPEILIRTEMTDDEGTLWSYTLEIDAKNKAEPIPMVKQEVVTRQGPGKKEEELLRRPDPDDRKDRQRLTQTAIEQISANREFRVLADFFRSVLYLHLVPQLVREGQGKPQGMIGDDSLGRDLLDRIRDTPGRTQRARLRRIQEVLKIAAPRFESLELVEDVRGRPHLQVKFKHWRAPGAFQDESQFSDGTLRLIGLLWALQEKSGPLLLEEPELSLHAGLLTKLAPFIHRAQKAAGNRQIILSTHSEHLLSDPGIGADEVLLVEPQEEGSTIIQSSQVPDIRKRMVKAGLSAAEAALPRTHSRNLRRFDEVVA